jgi:hypothetical protein
MYHAVRLSVGNKLFFAPITEPTCVLDIGTGTGESVVYEKAVVFLD